VGVRVSDCGFRVSNFDSFSFWLTVLVLGSLFSRV
jgi:hypothetical protein